MTIRPARIRWEGFAVHCWSRLLSLAVALGLFVWLLSHAGGFHPDGSPVDPSPPAWYLMFGGMMLYSVLIVYAAGGVRWARGGHSDHGGSAGSSDDGPGDAGEGSGG